MTILLKIYFFFVLIVINGYNVSKVTQVIKHKLIIIK